MKVDILDAPAEDVRIEIIPLIDVIFCILTFFILAAVGLTRQQAIDLDLPNADTGSPLPPQGLGAEAIQRERLYVSVDAIGQIYLDQQPVSTDLLYDVLLQHRQISPQGLIVLYASRDARYEDVIRVLDLLRSVGGDRVALATLPGESLDSQIPGLEGLQQPGADDSLLDLTPLPSDNDPLLEGLDQTAPSEPLPALPSEGEELGE
ncbi:biopolymer transporter ExbD [Oscillatoria sp. CS-180]|uniref:ExbD/TolR family protein n=1 Tax=Oscillatoria sp. CS-180 TaxID=3021720 RepID=UPI00232EF9B8|nr:biopolymer transporter ExbD [Oscillatoria sp. CS-180]MDB9528180.1 biopolymer transporter ExbD [Oscillatoria sp. CS-180]